MNQLAVGEFKSNFSQVLQKVLQGESIGITFGKSKKSLNWGCLKGKLLSKYAVILS